MASLCKETMSREIKKWLKFSCIPLLCCGVALLCTNKGGKRIFHNKEELNFTQLTLECTTPNPKMKKILFISHSWSQNTQLLTRKWKNRLHFPQLKLERMTPHTKMKKKNPLYFPQWKSERTTPHSKMKKICGESNRFAGQTHP